MRPSTRKWLFALLGVALIGGASTRIGPLNRQREKHHLVLPPLPKTVRPSMLLTPLLAVGRAPLVDYLWIRATNLKDQGRFFDAYQLSQMICELQPKFASVWAFQAWNMSYNISVTLKSPEERWRWVRNGFELLRDKAIPLNPNNAQLYKELAWILFHKVGDFMDEWHGYYKLQFALMMEDILGEPPEGYTAAGRARGDFYRFYDFKPLAEAPENLAGLLEKPGVSEFIEQLQTYGFDAREKGVFLGLLSSLKTGQIELPNVPEGEKEDRLLALKALMTDPETQAAREAIETFWRAYRLRSEVKLDPQRIVELEEGFGITFDFRLAETHALYWGNVGLEKGTDRRVAIDIHKLNTNRIEFYALQKMFHRGRLAMGRDAKHGEPPLLDPDIRVVPILFEAFLRDSKKYLDMEKGDEVISENFRTGFVGFMRTAILRYYELGMAKEALEKFEYLREHLPDPMYENGLEGFLAEQFKSDRELNDYARALARIDALIRRGLVRLAYDEDEMATRYFNRGKRIYDMYQKDQVSDRMRFPFSFAEILERAAHAYGGQMYRASYENICQKLGLEPLPPTTTTMPAG